MSKMDISQDSRYSARDSATKNLQQIRELNLKLDAMPEQLSSQLQPLSQRLQQMQSEAQALSSQLQQLPPYLAQELSQQIEPLTQLPLQVQQALQAFDQVNQSQRQVLDELTTEQRQQMSQRLKQIDKAISQLQQQLQPISQLPAALKRQATLLKEAREELETSSQQLSSRALKVRPAWWKRAASLAAAGAVGGLLVMTGQVAFDRLVPPSAVQAEAEAFRVIWQRATDQERQLMQRIGQRQGR
jgi:DNA repair exonuclease SbcCD ATPase subunit